MFIRTALPIVWMAFVCTAQAQTTAAPALPETREQLLERLPKGDVWLAHAVNDLKPFWVHPDALGSPLGAFPTVRCDDGTLVNYEKPCPEVANSYLRNDRQRYLVALSRQTYGYGVLFHLTGDPVFMDYMRAGVRYIRENCIDPDGGGMRQAQNADTGEWGPKRAWRDPQQLAYGLLGMSFYYYLTRDPEVLPDILAAKDYILSSYYSDQLGVLRWMLEDNGAARASQRKLTAQLDQMNAYMVLLAPILPPDAQADVKWALRVLCSILMREFYSEKENVFFLQVDKPDDLDLEKTGTTDFGHTIKSLWMIRNTGLLTGDEDLVRFAEDKGRQVLERAYLSENGSWASAPLKGGQTNIDKTWWIYCELDQFAGSLALTDPLAARHLPNTHNYFLSYFPDKSYGEIWGLLDGKTNLPRITAPKAYQWKSAYHSLEHALVGYITSSALHGDPVTLYYNFVEPQAESMIQPYFYTGRLAALESFGDRRGREVQKVVFSEVR
jgi:mannose/cellobiose epimerase-like protein (N-acyl-D-glucosamine 2-epimerase family)